MPYVYSSQLAAAVKNVTIVHDLQSLRSSWVQHLVARMLIDGGCYPSSLPSGKLLKDLPALEEVEKRNSPYFELLREV